ncbi:MAG: ATP-binding protein [Oligoflexales bacterium]|nr:ATP-binding protein [Oligoflexales bacterium]
MYKRINKPIKSNSFFLFGARGTGKSSFLNFEFKNSSTLWIDLLNPETESQYISHPNRLSEQITERAGDLDWVVIDEVQRAPKLLDVVHWEIENRKIKFALTGSSARKLKRGGANLLAGRAFLNHLYPLTHIELEGDFKLLHVLAWGSLPKIFQLSSNLERSEFLKAYVNVYLKEEVFQEQLVRNTDAFRKFLPIAAQMNGKILNFNSISKDLNIDWTTVKTYFEILEDTWLGFFLPAYDRSLRKQQLKASKFYFFDIGVQRALEQMLSVAPTAGQMIGPLFEHFIILEIYRLNDYLRKDYRLSYLATQGGLEVDIIIDRPGKKSVLIEIKSATNVREDHIRNLQSFAKEYSDFDAICLCQETTARQVDNVIIYPWREGLETLFSSMAD